MKTRSQKVYLILMVVLFLAALGLFALNERAARQREAALPRQLAPLRATALRLDSLLHHVWQHEAATDEQRNLMRPYLSLLDAMDADAGSPSVKSQAAALLPGLKQVPTAKLSVTAISEALTTRIYDLQDSISRLNIADHLISVDFPFQDYLKTGQWNYHAATGYAPAAPEGWIVSPEWMEPDSMGWKLNLSDNFGFQSSFVLSTEGLVPAGQDSVVVPYRFVLKRTPPDFPKEVVEGSFVVVR
jgi:hypothetical protein